MASRPGAQGRAAPQPTRADLWRASIKIPMYTVAVTPIAAGSAAGYADTQALYAGTLAAFLAAAVCIIAWLNCTNDVFDFDTGIDVNKRESLVNLCGATRTARNAVLAVATALLAAGFASLYALSAVPTFDRTVLVLIGVAVCGGYAYQGPPFRLGYLGLGEPICFVTWFISTAAAYYSQVRRDSFAAAEIAAYPAPAASLRFLWARLLDPLSYAVGAVSLLVALPTAVILFCSHFHQLVDDRAAGKRSPIVRLGTERAARVLRVALIAMFALQAVAYLAGALPPLPALLASATAPHAVQLAAFVSEHHAKPERVRAAKYFAVRLHFFHGMALTAGYLLTGYVRTGGL
jgi:2-carboxy-1,4-naphthoquinone phytyltransferase